MKITYFKITPLACSAMLLFMIAASCSIPASQAQFFDLEKIARDNLNCELMPEKDGSSFLAILPEESNTGVVIWEKGDKQIWNNEGYLTFEIYGDNDFSGVINIEFFRQTGEREKAVLQSGEVAETEEGSPRLSSLMGILPRIKTKVVFPLSYLNAQTLFVTRSPRQLKGTINGDRLEPEDISKVVLRFGPYFEPYFTPRFTISSISIVEERPTPYEPIAEPVIDELGQWKLKEWTGKLRDEEEMIQANQNLRENALSAKYPENWSRYGGWKKKKFEASGFFRTHHDGERWWLVDPDGYGFLSVGVDCIGRNSSGPVDGIEDLFDWLPTKDDAEFPVLSETRGGNYMDFYQANLIRSFGGDWVDDWNVLTAGLMKKLRFNTVGNWSDIDFARDNEIPYVLPMQDFPSTKVLLYRDFPDVFSPEYKRNSERFAAQLAAYKDDPYLIGYFLRNEPHWAFGYHNLAYEMFGTDQQSATKTEFLSWIEEKYAGDLDRFNKSWQLDLSSFGELASITFKEYPSKTADSDFYEFSEIMVSRYIDIPCDEVEKVDDNHLNLGMRYAWLSSDLLYKAGERFDVFSINGYGINPPPTAEIAERSGKPVMIGEFHHGAVDRGLPATGITGVLSQQARAEAYRNYVEQGIARPELIGMHYFQWIDQPFYGRFDGENYNIGVVTIANIPYPELTTAMIKTNERVYQVGSGLKEPYGKEITKIPPIHY